MENGKWKIVLLAFFLGMSIVSFFWIIGCCMQNYIAEYFFAYTFAFAIICAASFISLAIVSKR